ncbi:MAG: type II toxin-antitoxin system HipA family toxin [Campylobacterota bacterium]|nr:type II toxin-antitoxin system HipA family toxin [Campylobacterota bacterium]
MKNIDVFIDKVRIGKLFFEKEKNQYGFNYIKNYKPISLIMPYKESTYIWANRLHPIFEMNMPEGYLFEIFKNYLSKEYGYIDDFLVFSYLCSNIQSRVTYESWFDKSEYKSVELNDVLKNDTPDTFSKILNMFLTKNAISGIQAKTLALVEDKASLSTKEYIIKTWGDEYPQLAQNEYFCLKAVQKSGVRIPNILLSENKKFLLVERFNYDKKSDEFLGFEEVLVLMGKNRDEKYSGSYEAIAKVIYAVTTDKIDAMKSLYKTIVMSYLLKNGDAHLKNFGVLYDEDFKRVSFAPTYDVVNTCVYLHKDRPALTMFGQKLWFAKKDLLKFGVQKCYLSDSQAIKYYKECILALKESIQELEVYIQSNREFKDVGSKMLESWKLSLDEKKQKELPDEITRNWNKNKKS